VTEDISFEADVQISFRIPCENEEAFIKELAEISNGAVTVRKTAEKYDKFDV
jgi:hypothetical protein